MTNPTPQPHQTLNLNLRSQPERVSTAPDPDPESNRAAAVGGSDPPAPDPWVHRASEGPGVEPTSPSPHADAATGEVHPVASVHGREPDPAEHGDEPARAASTAGEPETTRSAEPGSTGHETQGDIHAWPPDEAFDAVELDDRGWVRRNLEAILLVADEPVPATVLSEICGARLSEVEELLVELAGEYAGDGRGFVLRAVAGGWRLYTHPGAQTTVEAFLRAGQTSRLTRAALETLAVIAYRQPVTRFQVAAVRGVNVDGVFRTLLARGLIQEVGSDPGPGQASLYGTTPAFLEQLGLNALDQLPPIKDYLPEGIDLVELQEQP
jgi:segregation and condensation protein B